MATRLGTPYQRTAATQTDSYTILHDDDLIPFNIATAKNATLPAAADCNGSDGHKVIANLGSSADTLTLVAAAGDTIMGASTLAPGTAVNLNKGGPNAWTADSPFSAEGLTVPAIETADSKGVSSGVRASSAASLGAIADSKGVSAGVAGSVASSMGVVADSKGVSAGLAASVASSLGVIADSKGVSGGVAASVASSMGVVADSKGVSSGVRASSAAVNAATADSKAESGVVLLSALTSRVSSGE